MRKKILFRFFIPFPTLIILFTTLLFVQHTNAQEKYKWGNTEIVAGGFVTGIIYHPTEQGLAYARTDMGGAYRLNGNTRRWEPITDLFGASDWNMLGIESIALDPTDANKVYLACGTYAYNNWAGNGAIFRSSDKGTTWTKTNLNFKLGANEDGRGMGERMVVDPNSPNILYLGTRQNGLWKSTDFGATWSQVTTFPNVSTPKDVGLGFAVIDPASGTAGNASKTIYVGVANSTTSNLYRTTNTGSTWEAVPNAPAGMMPYKAALASNGTMYITYSDAPGPNGITTGAVWKFNTTTGNWTRILTPDGQGGFAGITVDAKNPEIVMTASICRWWPSDQIYRTTNGGSSWKAVGTGANITRDASASPYLRWGAADDKNLTTGNWVSALAIDPFNSDRVLYATGATVWGSDNIKNADNNTAIKWEVRAQGIEQTAVLDLASPNSGPYLLSGMGDICGFVHSDVSKSPAKGMIDPAYKNGESVDFAELNPSVMAIIGHDYTPNYMGSISRDAGVTWTRFTNLPANMQDGKVALNSNGTLIIWAPKNQAAYRSSNGSSWSQCNGLGGAAIVVSDRVNANKFFAIRNNTLYRSTDGGVNFSAAATSGFSGTKLKTVPGYEGNIWVPSSTGLYRSTNNGTSFSAITGVQSADVVGFGKSAPGKNHPTVFITGRVNNIYGVFRSIDEGVSWTRINDNLHQFGAVNTAIVGDARVYGRVYIATNGRGIIMGELATSTPDCNGVEGGSAAYDVCGICSGGNTGRTAVTDISECTITAIDSYSQDFSISYHPNPFTDNLNLTGSGEFSYLVRTLEGQTVTQGSCKENCQIGDLPGKGIYLLELQSSGKIENFKIIKY